MSEAALRYQHATADRDAAVAHALSDLAELSAAHEGATVSKVAPTPITRAGSAAT